MRFLTRVLTLVVALALPLHAVEAVPEALPELTLTAQTPPLRVAIVGSGPAGFFAAEALLKQQDVKVQVDVFDKAPAPTGLVRAGVAPDHQAAKASTALYDKVAADPAFRYFGNVALGKDLSAADLTKYYDRVIYATGAQEEKKLGIPGEDLEGVHGVSSFVGWYNSQADHYQKNFDLSNRHAVVIGAGPVGLDAVRILAQDPAKLAATDISARAHLALESSRVKEIHMLGRRGPADATYSLADLKEVGSLESADLVVSPKHPTAQARESANAAYLAEKSKLGEGDKEKKVRLRFYATPIEIVGENGKVTGVKVRTESGSEEIVPAGLVLRAIGYKGTALPGIPFDDKAGVIPNADGRVLDPTTNAVVPNVYVAGWAKHGAKGLIKQQKDDAQATVKALLEDSIGKKISMESAGDVADLLKSRGVRFITKSDWKKIDKLEKEAGAATGKTREKFATADEMFAALTRTPTPRSTQGPIVVEKNGVKRPLGYNPAIAYPSLWSVAWDWIRHFPTHVARVFRFVNRVQEHLDEITDADLAWSLNRYNLFENQEGILRLSNRELVNNWKHWTSPNLRNVGPDDFNGASVSRISIRKIFKQAMDREEPTRAYQYTASMNLHNYVPRVAHFMGISMQERVIAIALTGKPPEVAVWAQEEERHGNIMERVYNLSREPGQPELKEQGIAVTSPEKGEYSARSMLANRSLAEIGAATGYLFLKANARKGSPADLSLEGIFRDEVYHYVLMNAGRKWGFGLKGRWSRLFNLVRHSFDNPLPDAIDATIDERKGFSPLTIFEIAYAFYQIDKRVERYLDTVPDEVGRKFVGKVYKSEKEVTDAIARGEHTWTDAFPMEVNPEMSADDVRSLEYRFPGRFSLEKRRLKSSQIREMVARYRDGLYSWSYWMRKKGFSKLDESTDDLVKLRRVVGKGDDAARFDLQFPKAGAPHLKIEAAGKTLYDGPLMKVSMRQLGAAFAAEDASGLAKWDELKTEFTPKEIVGRLVTSPVYQKEPIPLDDEVAVKAAPAPAAAETAAAKSDKDKAVDNRPYRSFMCLVCGYKYNEKDGDPTQGIAPGTRWEDVPETWVCPECGESKQAFEEDMVEVPDVATTAPTTLSSADLKRRKP